MLGPGSPPGQRRLHPPRGCDRVRRMWRRVRYVLLLVGLAALATCPAAWRDYRRKNRGDEARELLRYMAGLVEAEYTRRDGRFPQQPAGPTPPVGRCCEQGGACEVDAQAWADPA